MTHKWDLGTNCMTHINKSQKTYKAPLPRNMPLHPHLFSPSTCRFQVFSPHTGVTGSPRQQRAASATRLPMQRITIHYTTAATTTTAPTTCKQKVQSQSGRPAQSSSIAHQTFKLTLLSWQCFFVFPPRQSHRVVPPNRRTWGLSCPGGTNPLEKLLINAVITATVYR